MINRDARHVFGSIMDIIRLKCVAGYNHYGQWDKLLNKNVSDRCDACDQLETWAHIL